MVQIMVWHQKSGKSLPEPMNWIGLHLFNDTHPSGHISHPQTNDGLVYADMRLLVSRSASIFNVWAVFIKLENTLWCCYTMHYDIAYSTALTETEHKSRVWTPKRHPIPHLYEQSELWVSTVRISEETYCVKMVTNYRYLQMSCTIQKHQFVINGGTVGCSHDNLQYHQIWQIGIMATPSFQWPTDGHPGGHLTHLPQDKMVTNSPFSNAFSWMKSFVLWFEFHWSLFLRVQFTISQHWFR